MNYHKKKKKERKNELNKNVLKNIDFITSGREFKCCFIATGLKVLALEFFLAINFILGHDVVFNKTKIRNT